MAVTVDTVAHKIINIAADVPYSVPIPAYGADQIEVYTGVLGALAEVGTDYNLTFGNDFNTFTATFTPALVDALNEASDNTVTVRRLTPALTEATPAGCSQTRFVSQEFDLIAMRDQEQNERMNRSLVFGPQFVGDTPLLRLDALEPNRVLMASPDGLSIIAGPTAAEVADAEADAQRAEDAADTVAGQLPLSGYAAALAAPKPAPLTRISAVINGRLIDWVRLAGGTCLGGGWVPADAISLYHYGASESANITSILALAQQFAQSSGRGVVHVPKGTWLQNGSGIDALDNVTLKGEGKGLSIISKVPGVEEYWPILKERAVAGVSQPVTNFAVRGISFIGNGDPLEVVTATTALIRFYSSFGFTAENCEFAYSRGYGLGFQGNPSSGMIGRQGPHEDTRLINCDFHHNGLAEYISSTDPMDGVDFKSADGFYAEGCRAWANGDKGFDIRAKRGRMVGCLSWDNATHGFEHGANAIAEDLEEASMALEVCYAWDNGGGGFRFWGSPFSTRPARHSLGNCVAYGNLNGIDCPDEAGGNDIGVIDLTIAGGHFDDNLNLGINVPGARTKIVATGASFDRNVGGAGFSTPQTVKSLLSSCTMIGNSGRPFSLAGGVALEGCRIFGNGSQPLTTLVNIIKSLVNDVPPSLTSAASIRLPEWDDVIFIAAGAVTAITSIEASWAGRTVTLRFPSTSTITLAHGSNVFLSGGATWSASPRGVITLMCDGTNWYQTSRSNNA